MGLAQARGQGGGGVMSGAARGAAEEGGVQPVAKPSRGSTWSAAQIGARACVEEWGPVQWAGCWFAALGQPESIVLFSFNSIF
jgi:hypothetical protein